MKGQIFIMMSVLVLIALMLLRNSLTHVEIDSEDFLYENFVNVKNELIKTVDVSILDQEDVSGNLNDFIAFSRDVFGERGYDESIEFQISSNGNTTTVNVNFTLRLENSFIQDSFIINRTVYS